VLVGFILLVKGQCLIVTYLKLKTKANSLRCSYCCIVSSCDSSDVLAVLCIIILLKYRRGSQRPEVNPMLSQNFMLHFSQHASAAWCCCPCWYLQPHAWFCKWFFVGLFANFWEVTVGFVISVCSLSVCLSVVCRVSLSVCL